MVSLPLPSFDTIEYRELRGRGPQSRCQVTKGVGTPPARQVSVMLLPRVTSLSLTGPWMGRGLSAEETVRVTEGGLGVEGRGSLQTLQFREMMDQLFPVIPIPILAKDHTHFQHSPHPLSSLLLSH